MSADKPSYRQIENADARNKPRADPLAALASLGAKWSPAFTRPGPLEITARDCVLCGPDQDCDCASTPFGSLEYMAKIDRLHGRK